MARQRDKNAPKAARLKEFFKRLRLAEPARNHDEALALITRVLNSVEDQMTSIPYAPHKWRSDGRLYPPEPDAMREVKAIPNVKRYRSVAHNTFIAANGAIQIAAPPPFDGGKVLFSKKGANGDRLKRG